MAGGTRSYSAKIMRAEAVAHLRAHKVDYKEFWNGKDSEGHDISEKGFDAYVNDMALDAKWGGALELRALGKKFDTQIVVISKRADAPNYIFHEEGEAGVVYLLYNGNHYDLLEGNVDRLQKVKRVHTTEPLRGGSVRSMADDGPLVMVSSRKGARSSASSSVALTTTSSVWTPGRSRRGGRASCTTATKRTTRGASTASATKRISIGTSALDSSGTEKDRMKEVEEADDLEQEGCGSDRRLCDRSSNIPWRGRYHGAQGDKIRWECPECPYTVERTVREGQQGCQQFDLQQSARAHPHVPPVEDAGAQGCANSQ